MKNFKFTLITLSTVLGIIFLMSCTKKHSDTVTPTPATCNFDGKWVSCSPQNGTDSQKVTLNVNGTQLSELIESYTGVTDCSNTSTGNMTLDFTLTMGTQKASATIAGGTDLSLKPAATADVGCGAGMPFYTTIVFADNCLQFTPAEGQPPCTQAAVSTQLSTQVFVKQ
jgi:hypothetical protein